MTEVLATELPRVKSVCFRQFDDIAGILPVAEAA
jgi:hypothetical protein